MEAVRDSHEQGNLTQSVLIGRDWCPILNNRQLLVDADLFAALQMVRALSAGHAVKD
jgi:hypothetical protein